MKTCPFSAPRRLTLQLVVALSAALGCQESPPPTAAPATAAREEWQAIYMNDTKIGHLQTTEREVTAAGRRLREIRAQTQVTVRRDGQANTIQFALTSRETPDGKLIDFESVSQLSDKPLLASGQVVHDRLIIHSLVDDRRQTSEVAWPASARGFFGVEQSLEARPLKPGERRTLDVLAPIVNQLARVELIARQEEETEVLGSRQTLLRIEQTMTIAGGPPLRGIVWTDRQGQTIKTLDETSRQVTYRTTKEQALKSDESPPLDVLTNYFVKLDRPLPQGHRAPQATYLVELPDRQPADVFPSGPTQAVEPVGERAAKITVRRAAPQRAAGTDEAPPSDDERRSGGLVQSDDPLVVKLAQQAAGDERDPWQAAIALERFVKGYMREVNFSQALASAAEVARARKGDCTEHAVLLAALARARGIPARVAVGLVYIEPEQALGFHMWTEVHVAERWLPLDGTRPGGVGGGHLKLSHSSLRDTSGLLSFLPVTQVMGRLKIKLLEP
jgi:transglutaminase-like putative cysteine protease